MDIIEGKGRLEEELLIIGQLNDERYIKDVLLAFATCDGEGGDDFVTDLQSRVQFWPAGRIWMKAGAKRDNFPN